MQNLNDDPINNWPFLKTEFLSSLRKNKSEYVINFLNKNDAFLVHLATANTADKEEILTTCIKSSFIIKKTMYLILQSIPINDLKLLQQVLDDIKAEKLNSSRCSANLAVLEEVINLMSLYIGKPEEQYKQAVINEIKLAEEIFVGYATDAAKGKDTWQQVFEKVEDNKNLLKYFFEENTIKHFTDYVLPSLKSTLTSNFLDSSKQFLLDFVNLPPEDKQKILTKFIKSDYITKKRMNLILYSLPVSDLDLLQNILDDIKDGESYYLRWAANLAVLEEVINLMSLYIGKSEEQYKQAVINEIKLVEEIFVGYVRNAVKGKETWQQIFQKESEDNDRLLQYFFKENTVKHFTDYVLPSNKSSLISNFLDLSKQFYVDLANLSAVNQEQILIKFLSLSNCIFVHVITTFTGLSKISNSNYVFEITLFEEIRKHIEKHPKKAYLSSTINSHIQTMLTELDPRIKELLTKTISSFTLFDLKTLFTTVTYNYPIMSYILSRRLGIDPEKISIDNLTRFFLNSDSRTYLCNLTLDNLAAQDELGKELFFDLFIQHIKEQAQPINVGSKKEDEPIKPKKINILDDNFTFSDLKNLLRDYGYNFKKVAAKTKEIIQQIITEDDLKTFLNGEKKYTSYIYNLDLKSELTDSVRNDNFFKAFTLFNNTSKTKKLAPQDDNQSDDEQITKKYHKENGPKNLYQDFQGFFELKHNKKPLKPKGQLQPELNNTQIKYN